MLKGAKVSELCSQLVSAVHKSVDAGFSEVISNFTDTSGPVCLKQTPPLCNPDLSSSLLSPLTGLHDVALQKVMGVVGAKCKKKL